MKLLHTADWHVGKTLRGRSRADEHCEVLAEIAGLAAEHDVDVVLIGGDLFENAAPTPESERIVYEALLAFARREAQVVIIGGNHDSGDRLEAVRPLLELTNIHVRARLARPGDGGVLRLSTRRGDAHVALLPFLSQRGIVRAADLMSADAVQHAQSYADRAARILEALCAALPDDGIRLVLAHAMVHGGVMGGGERSAHTVFEYSVPSAAFPASLHYVALGHLHREQTIQGQCPIRYCGSPLQLDFGETRDRKSVNLIEAEPGKPARVEVLALQSGKRLRTVTGTLEQLEAQRDELGDDLLRVDVDSPPLPGLADQVRELLPNALDVRLVQREENTRRSEARDLTTRSPQELFAAYLREQEAENGELQALFAELLEEAHAPDPA